MKTPCELLTTQMGLLFTCEQVGEYTKIQTPFLYPDGDIIDLFYREKEGMITLTDLGETLRWLRMQMVTQQTPRRQNQLIDDICLTLGIERFRGMLMTNVESAENFTEATIRLSQAALRVSDLWFTFRTSIVETVIDEVVDLFQDHHINFQRSPKISGRSARVWQPDFQTRQKQHSSLIRVMSTGSHATAHDIAARTSAMWHDLSHLTVTQKNLQLVSLIDDTFDVWENEDIRLVGDISEVAYWSRTDEFLEKIA